MKKIMIPHSSIACYLTHLHHQTLIFVRTVTVRILTLVTCRNRRVLLVYHLVWRLTNTLHSFMLVVLQLALQGLNLSSESSLLLIIWIPFNSDVVPLASFILTSLKVYCRIASPCANNILKSGMSLIDSCCCICCSIF